MSELDALVWDAMDDARWWRYFNQGERWQPDNRVAVNIADMSPEWRLNCVRFLERRAANYAALYVRGCEAELLCALRVLNGEMARDSIIQGLDAEASGALADPVVWVRSTRLCRALAAGLPVKGKKLRVLERQAAHWSGCEWRAGKTGDCSCERLRQEHGAQRWAHVDVT